MGFWPIPESYWPENTMNSLVKSIYFILFNIFNKLYYLFE